MKLSKLVIHTIGIMMISQIALAESVKIGFITTLTGGAGAIGNDMRDAVELALDHLGRKMAGKNVEVIFSIDGLEDTNHIYRRNVIWNKLIDNCTSYINAGGKAHWDMLVYKHNQHQVDDCMELAKTLGFTWFRAKVSKRAFVNGLEFPDKYENPKIEQGTINCMALQESSMYISATGDAHPCCWLGNDLNNTLQMADVKATWNTDTPHPTCKRTCSTVQNSFQNQWQREVELC